MRSLTLCILLLVIASSALAQTGIGAINVEIPVWVTDIPNDGFVGISDPCNSIAQARTKAFDSVIAEILRFMGAEYTLTHESRLTPPHLNESITYSAKWFVGFIQQNIKRMEIQRGSSGYVCYVLVELSPQKIEYLKKLSIGPKILARVTIKSKNQVFIRICETVGVKSAIMNYTIKTVTKNNHAQLISLFFWKISESTTHEIAGVFEPPVILNANARIIPIPAPNPTLSLKSIVLGEETRTEIILHGHDEMGRTTDILVK